MYISFETLIMKNLITLLLLLAVSLPSHAEGFKTVTLSEAFLPPEAQQRAENTISLPFTIPDNFTKRYLPEAQAVVWGTEKDIEVALQSGSFAQSKSGLFTLKPSANVGYNGDSKKFSNEDELPAQGKQYGFSDLKLQKNEIQGYPMFTVTALNGNRHLFLHYIALGEGTMLINYYHPENFSNRDSDIWTHFIDGLKKKN